jgi:hypothetical protein
VIATVRPLDSGRDFQAECWINTDGAIVLLVSVPISSTAYLNFGGADRTGQRLALGNLSGSQSGSVNPKPSEEKGEAELPPDFSLALLAATVKLALTIFRRPAAKQNE